MNIPVEIETVVLKAMATEKRDRYPHALAFQDDLQAYLEGRALTPARYNPFKLLANWLDRHPAVKG